MRQNEEKLLLRRRLKITGRRNGGGV